MRRTVRKDIGGDVTVDATRSPESAALACRNLRSSSGSARRSGGKHDTFKGFETSAMVDEIITAVNNALSGCG
jgi:hypothetical protein